MASEQPQIEVDDAAEYFGATSSSDSLHAMLGMARGDAFASFFGQLSDLVLQPGDFDFEEAALRMSCEGGELYYLVAGHLGIMTMADPLRRHLGLPDSNGDTETSSSSLEGASLETLTLLTEPMRLLRLFAIAQQTGGEGEVRRYLSGLEGMLQDPSGREADLLAVAGELDAALDVQGQVLPIGTLAAADASAVALEILAPSIPVIEPVSTLAPAPPSQPQPELPATEEKEPEHVPLPPSQDGAVPLPPAPVVEDAVPEPVRAVDDRRMDAAAADAFAGAFGSSLVEDEEPATLEERFEHADEDGSGGLSIEELAEATGTDLEEAARLHAAADTDGDGQVTLEEFSGSEAAVKAAALPKPVRAAPVRAPVAGQPQQAAPAPQPAPATPQQAWPQRQPAQGMWPQQPQQTLGGLANQQPAWPQQQGWAQPQQHQGWSQQPQQGWVPQPMHNVPPTIPSGIRCPGCGIGIDGQWRFCPVCGSRNPAMPY